MRLIKIMNLRFTLSIALSIVYLNVFAQTAVTEFGNHYGHKTAAKNHQNGHGTRQIKRQEQTGDDGGTVAGGVAGFEPIAAGQIFKQNAAGNRR